MEIKKKYQKLFQKSSQGSHLINIDILMQNETLFLSNHWIYIKKVLKPSLKTHLLEERKQIILGKKNCFFINDTNNIQVYTYWINGTQKYVEAKVKVWLQNHSQHSLLSFSNINKIVPCYSVTCFSYKIYISMSVLVTHLFFFKLFVLIFYFILKVIVCIHHKKSNNTNIYKTKSKSSFIYQPLFL